MKPADRRFRKSIANQPTLVCIFSSSDNYSKVPGNIYVTQALNIHPIQTSNTTRTMIMMIWTMMIMAIEDQVTVMPCDRPLGFCSTHLIDVCPLFSNFCRWWASGRFGFNRRRHRSGWQSKKVIVVVELSDSVSLFCVDHNAESSIDK